MAASPTAADVENLSSQDRYVNSDDLPSEPAPIGSGELEPPQKGEDLEPVNAAAERSDEYRRSEPPATGSKGSSSYREKQIKPNKVYIGGLPEYTREEDLQNCFGKIGNIINIELKLGYGFVEFDSREAAEESVAKYHEGFFMGNKIRVELSHGGGRTARYNGDPGACFKCGQMGHWARECPGVGQSGIRKSHNHHNSHYPDPPVERREYAPPPRDYAYREDYNRYPSSRGEPRYGYDYPPPQGREARRPPSPPRDLREYPPNVSRQPREYEDYRMRGAPPTRAFYSSDAPPSYTPRGYDAPPERSVDRRPPPATDRYAAYPAPVPSSRPRTPPGPPPRMIREDYDRVPSRDYAPPVTEYRGRPTTPPLPPPQARYSEYSARTEPQRYRRRSQSPPHRASASTTYRSGSYSEAVQDLPYSSSSSYPATGGYSGNGYASGPSSSGRNGARDRDFTRSGPDPVYSRRA